MSWAEVYAKNIQDARYFTTSGTFVAPASAFYYVTCIGKGGVATAGTSATTYAAGTTGYAREGQGGASGGVSQHKIFLAKGTSVAVTVTDSISKFGNYCQATAANGTTAGTASGGNLANYNGNTSNNADGADTPGGIANTPGGAGGPCATTGTITVGVDSPLSTGGGSAYGYAPNGGKGGKGYHPAILAVGKTADSSSRGAGGNGFGGGGGGVGAYAPYTGDGVAATRGGACADANPGQTSSIGGGAGGNGGGATRVNSGQNSVYGGGGGGGAGGFGAGSGAGGIGGVDGVYYLSNAQSGASGGAGAGLVEIRFAM